MAILDTMIIDALEAILRHHGPLASDDLRAWLNGAEGASWSRERHLPAGAIQGNSPAPMSYIYGVFADVKEDDSGPNWAYLDAWEMTFDGDGSGLVSLNRTFVPGVPPEKV